MNAGRVRLSRVAVARYVLAVACVGLVVWGYFAWAGGDTQADVARQQAPGPADLELRALQDAALNDQARAALEVVDEMLARFPPSPQMPLERRGALMALDAVLRDPDAAQRPAVQQFFHRRIEQALAQIRGADVRSGATVWQMYNHGFVVRTPSATLCFDLVRARYLPGFALAPDLMRRIAGACDALFVSHVHADHAEDFVAQSFIDQGKPVVAPEQVGYEDPLYARIIHLEPRADKTYGVNIRHGTARLQVVIYPGHQGLDIDNNVVLVTTPDGMTVVHTGDQWHAEDFEWIDLVARRFSVDILLPNDWTFDIGRMVRGINPALVIPGHANELGHGIEKRQPYWLSVQRKLGSDRFRGNRKGGYPQPLVVLAWGESFHYERARAAQR